MKYGLLGIRVRYGLLEISVGWFCGIFKRVANVPGIVFLFALDYQCFLIFSYLYVCITCMYSVCFFDVLMVLPQLSFFFYVCNACLPPPNDVGVTHIWGHIAGSSA